MRLIDLSQPIFHECPHCPEDPPVRVEVIADHKKEGWRVEELQMTSHTGSHLDAPLHALPKGKSIDALPLERFTGEALIADLRDCRPGRPLLSGRLQIALPHSLDDRIILIATGWGKKRAATPEWLEQAPFLTPEAAEWLVFRKVRGVGIDHFSIGGVREEMSRHTHQILLRGGVWILEDLHFPDEVFALPQPTRLWALPINLRGLSGAFCRPVLATDAPAPKTRRTPKKTATGKAKKKPSSPGKTPRKRNARK